MTELEVLLQNFITETEPESWMEEEDILHIFGEARHVLLSLQIVCPRVIEYRGCIFLKQFTFLEPQIAEVLGHGEITERKNG